MESVQAPITVMQRVEWKYILSAEQTEFFRERLKGHMEPDAYGLTTIQSLYYDTPDRRLVRTSIEKPEFKEKIRLRAYGRATDASPVFLELKRKAFGIVYKRRVQATVPEVKRFFAVKAVAREDEIQQGVEERHKRNFSFFGAKDRRPLFIFIFLPAIRATAPTRCPSITRRSGFRFLRRATRSLRSRCRIRSRCGLSAFFPKGTSNAGASANTAKHIGVRCAAERSTLCLIRFILPPYPPRSFS